MLNASEHELGRKFDESCGRRLLRAMWHTLMFFKPTMATEMLRSMGMHGLHGTGFARYSTGALIEKRIDEARDEVVEARLESRLTSSLEHRVQEHRAQPHLEHVEPRIHFLRAEPHLEPRLLPRRGLPDRVAARAEYRTQTFAHLTAHALARSVDGKNYLATALFAFYAPGELPVRGGGHVEFDAEWRSAIVFTEGLYGGALAATRSRAMLPHMMHALSPCLPPPLPLSLSLSLFFLPSVLYLGDATRGAST